MCKIFQKILLTFPGFQILFEKNSIFQGCPGSVATLSIVPFGMRLKSPEEFLTPSTPELISNVLDVSPSSSSSFN